TGLASWSRRFLTTPSMPARRRGSRRTSPSRSRPRRARSASPTTAPASLPTSSLAYLTTKPRPPHERPTSPPLAALKAMPCKHCSPCPSLSTARAVRPRLRLVASPITSPSPSTRCVVSPRSSTSSGALLYNPALASRCTGQIQLIVQAFAWLNPHAAFTLQWDGKLLVEAQATDPAWRKWGPSDPAPAVWYDSQSFSRLIAACVAHDQDHGRDRMVREFVAEFRGFARSDIQKRLLDDVGVARMSLRDFFADPKRVAK